MKFIVCDTYEEMSKIGADMFAEVIKNDPKCILGLATGSTPIGMYGELIKRNQAGEISFKDVTKHVNSNKPVVSSVGIFFKLV